jgi:hypothetical protein
MEQNVNAAADLPEERVSMFKPSGIAVAFNEIISKDPTTTKGLFENVFGWKFEKRDGEGPEVRPRPHGRESDNSGTVSPGLQEAVRRGPRGAPGCLPGECRPQVP